MKSPNINGTTIVYYRPDDPYQSFILEQEAATKWELALMIPLTLVLCIVLAFVLLPSMPKDVSDRFSNEITVETDVCYENEVDAEKKLICYCVNSI